MRALSDDNLTLMTDSRTGEKKVIVKGNISTLSIPELQTLLLLMTQNEEPGPAP